ncbi:Serine/threonine-protein kinase CBK1 [Yarrowia sp. B02]|nr:Serine/threonine-protein kinase CBK1 [Yarrowia sp. B02]
MTDKWAQGQNFGAQQPHNLMPPPQGLYQSSNQSNTSVDQQYGQFQGQYNQQFQQQFNQAPQQAQPSDYVNFTPRPDLLSKTAQSRAHNTTQVVSHYYKTIVQHAIERHARKTAAEASIDVNTSEERRNRVLTNYGKKETSYLRLRRTRLCLDDFVTVKVIGKGAFGEVRLVQKRDNGKIYAMKTMLKKEMDMKEQWAHVKAERDVLADSDSPWIVSLYYSFQDDQYLYLIMEFLPGGDLMTMLIKYDVFSEDITRFYIAECVLAIEAIHKLGFIHRDIKPDNILIDKTGHIKLSDFGLSTGFHKTHSSAYWKKLKDGSSSNPASQMGPPQSTNRQSTYDSIHLTMRQQISTWRKNRRLMAYSTVGTPDYIAPEIFVHQGYGQECDWWSLGAIMFECLVGWPPFCSEQPRETYHKIINWRETLQFPDDVHLSPESEDLIRRLLTSSENRLGRVGGANEIKAHPFFRGVDWSSIREFNAPFVPKLSSITDTSYFPTDELGDVSEYPQQSSRGDRSSELPFIGYTFSRFDNMTKRNAI